MNAINVALAEIRGDIPPELLSLVFSPKVREYLNGRDSKGRITVNDPGAIDRAIIEKVINGRVRNIVDYTGGVLVEIPLEGIPPEMVDRFTFIYRVPKDRTQGRTIVSALALSYGLNSSAISGYGYPNQNYQLNGCGHSSILDATNSMFSSNAPIQEVQTAACSIIGENVVMIEGYFPQARSHYLRCLLSDSLEFDGIKPAMYIDFGKLCLLATKAYIYTNYIVQLAQGHLIAGHELEIIKSIVDEYRSANVELFEYHKTVWARKAKMGDPRKRQRILKVLTGGW